MTVPEMYTQLSSYFLTFAAIVTTGFMFMYAGVPWRSTAYGRAMMYNSMALALAVDATLFLTLFSVPVNVAIGIEIVVYFVISLAIINKARLFIIIQREQIRSHMYKEQNNGNDPTPA